MSTFIWLSLAAMLAGSGNAPAAQLQCLHGPDETPAQAERRRDALRMARFINTAQAQARAREGSYLDQVEIGDTPGVGTLRQSRATFAKLSFEPGDELFPGWELTLEESPNGYWFLIKDKTDPCGFAYISNRAGVIYSAGPIR